MSKKFWYSTVPWSEIEGNFRGVPTDHGSDLNVPLLRKMVEWVEEDAKREDKRDKMWDQATWISTWVVDNEQGVQVCRTGCCLAGNVAITSGEVVKGVNAVGLESDFYVKGEGEYAGKYLSVEDFARMELGLDYYEAEALFDGNNDAEDIRAVAEDIVMKRTGQSL